MWRPVSGVEHYALCTWADFGAGRSGSEVDAAVTGVRNHHVGG